MEGIAMQLLLVFGVVFAIAAVAFALQNNVPVTITFLLWRFDSSLAMVLLLALGVGVLVAGLVSSPSVIKGGWVRKRLQRQVAELEKEKADALRRIADLESGQANKDFAAAPAEAPPKAYVGLKTLLAGEDGDTHTRGN